MKLFSKRYSDVGEPLIILHGLFGNNGNWGQHARYFADKFAVYGFDLRNHGRSEWHSSMTYGEMAADIVDTMHALEIESAHFIGHSMGGKTAMQVALNWPELVRKLVVVDIAPVHYKPHHQLIFAGLEALDLDVIDSRMEADEILMDHVEEKGVRDFLLTNLARDEAGNLIWRINIEAITHDDNDIMVGLDSENSFDGDVLFVKGKNSDYIQEKDEAKIFRLFPKAKIAEIEEAGHWVHAEQPEQFQSIVYKFLKQ